MSFVRTDTSTQGNWKNSYGLDGYEVIADTASYPAYATVTHSGSSTVTWASSTAQTRALQKSTSTTDRIAACWVSNSFFEIDINLSGGQMHPVALYFLDWDANGRNEKVEVIAADTGIVLDTRTVSSSELKMTRVRVLS